MNKYIIDFEPGDFEETAVKAVWLDESAEMPDAWQDYTEKHLGSQHGNQKRHGWRYGKSQPLSRLRRQRQGQGEDEWDEFKRRVRGGVRRPVDPKTGKPPKKAKPKKAKPKKKPEPKKPEKPELKPAGKPVSDGLNLDKLPKKGKYGPPVRDAIDAINQVHGDGNLPEIPVKLNSTTGYHGRISISWDDNPIDIAISRKGDHPMMTSAHEIGHFLDISGLPKGEKTFFSETPSGGFGALGKLRNAFQESRAVKQLTQLVNEPAKTTYIAGFSYTMKPDRNYLNYVLQTREIFARAYAQYIAVRSGNTQMMGELSKELSKIKNAKSFKYAIQWEPDDFEPIADAFDELFKEQGWLQ